MIQRLSVVAVAIFSFIGLRASRCDAWNSTSHEVIALIAFDQMSPQTKSAIFAVLRNHPRLNEDLLHDQDRFKDADLAMLARAATWPDMLRYPAHPMNRTEHHGRWHYVDYPFDLDGVQGPAPEGHWDGHGDPANLLQAMDKALTELRDAGTPADRKAIDLCWVEHLVGDIHQPLHAVSMFSKEFPQGDQGGNLVFIRNDANQVVALHTYWDCIEGLSLEPEDIRKIADRIERDHPAAGLKDQVSDASVADWAQESFALAKTVTYMEGALPHVTKAEAQTAPESVPALPAGYAQRALATADARVALAGYRLAAVLDRVAKGLARPAP
ncbi:MAG: S1/P1 nuclease [Tepidisphaeraceae bacterium]|jgi:hypothetical protein